VSLENAAVCALVCVLHGRVPAKVGAALVLLEKEVNVEVSTVTTSRCRARCMS
jgi:hypothetical protein